MKQSVKFLLFISMMLLVAASGWSQQCSSMTTSRNIEFDGDSKKEEMKVSVTEDNDKLCFGISSMLNSGDLTVEIFDPNGDKQGYFSIEGQSASKAKKGDMVCGQMNKEIKDPMKGDWVVKMLPKKASGKITIHTMQMQQSAN